MATELCDELRDQLLAGGVLSPAEVDEAEKEAKAESAELETILKRKQLLTEVQINALRAMRFGAPYCSLPDFLPSLRNAELLPEELVRRHVMYPLFCFDDVLTLIIADPNDLTGIDQVRRLTRKDVDICAGNAGEIRGLIERAYGANQYLEDYSADSILDAAEADVDVESQPVIRLVDELIQEAARQGASDIHIEPGEQEMRIRIRVDGVLREVPAPPLGLHRAVVSRIKIVSRLDISQTRNPQDGAFQFKSGDADVVVRVSVLPSVFGEVVVMRLLRNESESVSLLDLGMSTAMLEKLQMMLASAHGMVLVSGPTGSGKSTTLYAAMKSIVSPRTNIIAIEDPVEYRTSLIRQIQVNPEANLTFATGLRSVLRQDPDVIMVGEIRDAETAHISVQAALTGHLVLSTVHTNDAVSAVVRLRDIGVAPYLISSSLLGVLAQRLCRKICPECVGVDSPPAQLLRAIGFDPENLDFEPKRGKGCRRCIGSGYIGRTGIYELFEVDEARSKMIAQEETTEAIRQSVQASGMKTLVEDGAAKVRAGITTVEELARVAGRSW